MDYCEQKYVKLIAVKGIIVAEVRIGFGIETTFSERF